MLDEPQAQIDLRDISRPVMEGLMEKLEETVFLGILNRERVTIVDVVECRHDYKITSPIGTTIPLFAAATGKVFLSKMGDREALEMIRKKGLPRRTDKSITDPEQFLKDVKIARLRGYATDYEEYISGVRAVAAPIEGEKHGLAAIWVVGFKESLDDDKMKLLKKEIRGAVESISQRIRDQSESQVGASLKNI